MYCDLLVNFRPPPQAYPIMPNDFLQRLDNSELGVDLAKNFRYLTNSTQKISNGVKISWLNKTILWIFYNS